MIDYIKENLLEIDQFSEEVYETPLGAMIHVGEPFLEGEELNIEISEDMLFLADQVDAEHYIFKFGTNFYYSKLNEPTQFNPLKYLGLNTLGKSTIPFLGVHGRYEVMNGSRDYKEWVQKAKFLGVETLGLIEQNTLAGTIKFQKACHKEGLRSVIGASYTVERDNGDEYLVKLYVMDKVGWRNILLINKNCLIDNKDTNLVDEKVLFSHSEGLSLVIDPNTNVDMRTFIGSGNFDNMFVQVDFTEFESEDRDKENIERIGKYMRECMEDIPPILLNDAYYLDKKDATTKENMNILGSVKGQSLSYHQYFKHEKEMVREIEDVLVDNSNLIERGKESLRWIADNAVFEIELGVAKLPKYEMTPEEAEKYGDTLTMFRELVWEGVENRGLYDKHGKDVVDERMAEEMGVIERAGVYDYFLIHMRDVCDFSRSENQEVAMGRGSAAGSVVSYVLGIVRVDPLKWGLFFSRFLNEGRLYKNIKEEVVELNDGAIQIPLNKRIRIVRDGKKIVVSAKDIMEGDELV